MPHTFQHSKWCLFAAGEEVAAQDCHIGKACGVCTLPPISTIKMKGSCNQPGLKEEEKEWFDTGAKPAKKQTYEKHNQFFTMLVRFLHLRAACWEAALQVSEEDSFYLRR